MNFRINFLQACFALPWVLYACTSKKPAVEVHDPVSGSVPKIECREISGDQPVPSWQASVQFNATGTVASIALRKDKEPPINLRTAFDYKSYDLPEPKDEYSFPTGSSGFFVLTSQTGTPRSTAVWRQGNKNLLFDCDSTANSSISATSTLSESEPGDGIMRCFESTAEAGWELEIRITAAQGKAGVSNGSTEVTLQKPGEAPTIRRAAIVYGQPKPGIGSDQRGDSTDTNKQFSLVLSRNEKFFINRAGPNAVATWSRGATTTEFTCPQSVAH